jgi:hypothetical protein
MHLGQRSTDAATQVITDSSLPGLPLGYDAQGNPIYVAPAPTGVTPDAPTTVTSTPTDWSSISSALSNLVTGGITAYQAINLQNLQASLLQQGKPLLTPQQLALMAPQIGVGVAPATQNMIFMLAAGAGALLLFTSLMKHRARR